MAKALIIKNVKDAIVASSTILESAKNEVVWIVSPAMAAFFVEYGIPEKFKMLIKKGGRARGITNISGINLDVGRKLSDNGEEVRHVDQFQGAFMVVADRRESISSINVNIADLSLDIEIVGLWTDNQAYVDFLTATFEAAWKDAVDAEERLR